MTCKECETLLGDALDGTLSPSDEAAVRAHCADCSACRELLDDLRDIRQTAATLDRHQPSPHLRQAIAAQLIHPPAQRRVAWMPLAMAASVLLVLGTAGWLYLAAHRSATPDPTAQLASAASELQLAEQHYENAIAALEKLTSDKQNKLDPRVAEAIAQSLNTIDRAILDSRAALKAQPDSLVAQTSLLEALRMKVALLQDTVSLMDLKT
jgi:anti-sigma factor RsiW